MMLLATLAAVLVQGPLPPQAATPKPAELKEWKVPWEKTRPRDPYVARDGRVWFVGQAGNYVAVLDTVSGEFRRYELDPGTGPHNLIVDDANNVFYAGNRAAHIGKLDPATGKITKYPMPDPEARDPHTLIFDRNYTQNGLIWFTMQGSNMVGRFNATSGEVRVLRVPTPDGRPYGITQDSKGVVWFNEVGTNKLARIDPAAMAIKEYVLPEGTRDRRIAVTSDDVVWYVDYARGYLGRLDPATGAVQEWLNPSGASARPYAMGTDGEAVWFVETGVQPNRFVGFDPRTKEFFGISNVPSGAGTVRHMFYDARSQSFWFGTDVGTIGRAGIAGTRPRQVS